MRCVLVGPAAPLRGGIAVDNDTMAQALRGAGHQVEQVSFQRLYPSLFFPGRTQYNDPVDSIQTSSQPLAQPLLDSVNPLSWWRAARTIARFQPDLITLQWWHPFFAPCYATLLSLLRRACPAAQRLLISHNTRPHEQLPGQDLALRLVVRRCSGVIVHSRSEYTLTRRVAPGATVRIVDYPLLPPAQDGPSRERAQQQFGVSGRVLLFFGYIREYKGLDLLLQALAHIHQALDVSLLVAGEFYTPTERYTKLIDRLGISHRVCLLDRYVGEAEWAYLFAATDALVLPYRTASHSMSIALSYGYGKPVIVTNVGGLAEAVEDGKTGLVTNPDPTSLAAAIHRLYTELLVSGNGTDAAIAAKQQQYRWEPFIQLLTGWDEATVQKKLSSDMRRRAV